MHNNAIIIGLNSVQKDIDKFISQILGFIINIDSILAPCLNI